MRHNNYLDFALRVPDKCGKQSACLICAVVAFLVCFGRTEISPDNSDLSYIIIELIDDEGNVVPTADNELTVEVSGEASLQGSCRGQEQWQERERHRNGLNDRRWGAFRGCAGHSGGRVLICLCARQGFTRIIY